MCILDIGISINVYLYMLNCIYISLAYTNSTCMRLKPLCFNLEISGAGYTYVIESAAAAVAVAAAAAASAVSAAAAAAGGQRG